MASAIAGFAAGRWYLQGPLMDLGWKYSQFFFSYQELGFVKRGLVGTLLHPFPALETPAMLWWISWAFTLVFLALFARLAARASAGLERLDARWLIALCALSPALFLRQGFDVGRFDTLGLIATLAGIAALDAGAAWAAGILAVIALLIHEAYLLIGLPLLAAYWLSRFGSRPFPLRSAGRDALALLGPPALACLAIAAFGAYRPGLDALSAHFAAFPPYRAAVGPEANLDALSVLTRGLGENVRYALGMGMQKRAAFNVPVIALWGALMTAFFVQFHRLNGLRRGLLFASAFVPLLLSVLAYDYYRWVALMATNMFIVILLACRAAATDGRTLRIPRGWVTKLLLATCLLGPISNTKSFPVFFTFLDRRTPLHLPW